MSHTRARIPLPTEALTQEHREIARLLREFDGLPPEDRGRREWIFRQVEQRLLAHFTLEEEVLYPAIWETGEERGIEGIEESKWGHRIVRQVLAELGRLDPGTPAFDSQMVVLRQDLEEHGRAEEEHLVPRVRSLLPETLRILRERLDERREQLDFD